MIPYNYIHPMAVDDDRSKRNCHVQYNGKKGLPQIAKKDNLLKNTSFLSPSKFVHETTLEKMPVMEDRNVINSSFCLSQVHSLPKKTKRSVRFSRRQISPAISSLTIPANLDFDKDKLWYKKSDYKKFKEEVVHAVASEKLQQMKRKGSPSSFVQSLERIYSSTRNKFIDTTLSKQIIECALTKDPSRRGIESYLASASFLKEKDSYRRCIVKEYEKMQGDDSLDNNNTKIETLGEFSKKLTHSFRSFSRIMGEIDAAIATKN